MAELLQAIALFKEQLSSELNNASDEKSIEEVRIKFLGRNGQLTELMALLKNFSSEEKRTFGPLLNDLKEESQNLLSAKKEKLYKEQLRARQEKEKYFDVTAYYQQESRGTLHPYTQIIEQIEDIFISMGYQIADGPEVEHEINNFEALNIPKEHPARDVADTFWLLEPHKLLRTHTSSVQVQVMKQQKPPIAIVAPGRCFRHEATDATHDYMFMQCEGLFIDKNISLNNCMATTKTFLQEIFEKKDIQIRTRPTFFPFVEPGIEIDMTCPFCTTGCSLCKGTRWTEICGAGLVHPNVLSFNGIDPQKYSGFAFGFGLSRLVMLKYGINGIRLLHSGNIDFLKQF